MTDFVVRNLSDRIVEVVRDRILSGAVESDRPIRQDALAAELGVSKIPLREALARLEQEGLVRSQANRGYFVRAMTSEEAEEVFALRLKLEPDMIALGSLRATVVDQRRACNALSALNRMTDEHDSRVGAANRAFHASLFEPSQCEITSGFLVQLHFKAERYVRKHLEPQGRDDRAKAEHQEILDCWMRRDHDGSARLVRDHIDRSLQDLRRQLAPRDPSG